MNAGEARKLSKINAANTANSQYEEIQKYIKNAVIAGDFQIRFYKPIVNGVKEKLEWNGFDVEIIESQRDDTQIIISW